MSRTSLESRVYEGADIIDSRDVIARIEELRDARPDMPSPPKPEDYPEDGSWSEDEEEELDRLIALEREASGCADDWHHGEALIADHYFEEYAQDLAEDIGAIDRNASWPLQHIDWKAAAEALQQDYTSVEYGSTTYWIRS